MTRIAPPFRSALATIALLSCLASGPNFAQTPSSTPPHLPGRIIVKTRVYPAGKATAELPSRRATAILRQAGLRSLRTPFAPTGSSSLLGRDRHGLGRIFEVVYDGSIDPRQLARLLEATGEVEYAEPVPVRQLYSGAPSDSAYSMQYALQLIDVEGAWNVTRGDSSIIIGIVDTGLDWEHEDLAANIWRNPGEIPDNGIDDEGNGFIDDVRGWDLIGDVTMEEALAGIFREDNDPKVRRQLRSSDLRNHGTHVGGIVAATGNNERGIAGVAYGCRLMPVKTASDSFATAIIRGYEGILYCARNGASVVNCSWGGPIASRVEQDVIAEAMELGCVVVVAGGNARSNNDAYDSYPANLDGVVSVGASDGQDVEAWFSNYGISTTLFAPGVDVLSTVSGNGYAASSGTSMASPVVAGVAALICSVHPDWSPARVRSQLRSTSDSVLRGSASNRPAFYGRVNARRAVEANGAPGSDARPGVVLAGMRWLDGGDDTVRTHGSRRLALRLRNNLAPVGQLSLVVAPVDREVEILEGATTTIDSLGSDQEVEHEIVVRISDATAWSQGMLAFQVGLRAGDYADFLIGQIRVQFPAGVKHTGITDLLVEEFTAADVHSPSPEVAWIFGELPAGGLAIIRIVNGRTTLSPIDLDLPVRIHAFDSLTCVALSSATVSITTDGGVSWQHRSADTAISYFDEMLFFSRTEWCAAGLLDSGRIPLARTEDGGLTWARDTVPMQEVVGSGFLSGSDWRGRRGWIGTGAAGIIYTHDAGRTWRRALLDSGIYVFRVSFWTETDGMAICFGPGGLRVALTSDGGERWTLREEPLRLSAGFGFLGSPEGTRTTYLMARNGSLLSTGSGSEWTQIPSLKLRTDLSDASVSASDSLVRIWYVGPLSGYLDIPLPTSSVRAPAVPTATFEMDAPHPNPAREQVTLRVRGARGPITFEIIDLLGRVHAARRLDDARDVAGATISVAHLPAGRYLVRARGSGASAARSLVVE